MKVVWKTGYAPKNVSAQTAYDVISGLQEEGKSEAADLVDASRPESAPLHPLFEWNDSIAAEKYREEQARCIIRHVCILQDEEEDAVPVRAFFQIDEDTSSYEPTMVIMNDEEKRERLLDIAKRELQAFRNKYKQLKELAGVISAIDKLTRQT